MLDFLLVLGRVPGTNLIITFTEIGFLLWGAVVWFVWKEHEKQYRRWLKWAWYRTCVNYRKAKRKIVSYIRLQKRLVILAVHRQKRRVKTYFRRQWRYLLRSIYLLYSFNIKRTFYIKQVQSERRVRKIKRSRPVQFFASLRGFISQSV